MLLQLEPLDYEVLADVLRRAMADLREEIYKTDAAEYQAQLKTREAILRGLIQQLHAAEASGLAAGEPASRQ
jgi:hypothetical protein